MSIYYCKECGKELKRDSKEKFIKSYCESSGKNVLLKKR